MDRFHRQVPKKDNLIKLVDKGASNNFIRDVKALKENIKIKELLRTVKMNSSMRVKAPRGKKVMENLSEDILERDKEKCETSNYLPSEETENNVENEQDIPPKNGTISGQTEKDSEAKGTNLEVSDEPYPNTNKYENFETDGKVNNYSFCSNIEPVSEKELILLEETNETEKFIKSDSNDEENLEDLKTSILPVRNDSTLLRDRKLSLDHTMLSRMQSMSQSEIDLHTMGKSPLERKSSFFRKKMDNFLKNTTEIFRRHSSNYKVQPVQKRGSISMSVSLQSLNENHYCRDFEVNSQSDPKGSTLSLRTSSPANGAAAAQPGSSTASQSSLLLAEAALCASQPDMSTGSTQNLAEESMLNGRAISMSSGLDSVQAQRRSTKAKRVTWIASEGLNNYLKRLIQDEKKKEPLHQSHQDLRSIKENGAYSHPRLDTKGRRLSYVRAVSGEDPAPRHKHHGHRKKHTIPESNINLELSEQLEQFTQLGVPSIRGYTVADIPDDAFWCLSWAERADEFEDFFNWKIHRRDEKPPEHVKKIAGYNKKIFFQLPYDILLTPNEEARQAAIRELVLTEAHYIKHLIAIVESEERNTQSNYWNKGNASLVEVFIATAHALQDSGKLLDIDTERLFANIPDILNASLFFFEATMFPMMMNAIENNIPFNTEYMASGFCRFRELFQPYEKYVSEHTKALDYMRSLANHNEFMTYLNWCHAQKSCNRLQLADYMVKPMQRLTKYSLILRRIIIHTDVEPERTSLIAMETFATNYVLDINRSIRQREELEILDHLSNSIETYEVDFKDDDLDRCFRMSAQLNLKAPMVNSLPNHSRSLIHQGDLRFKDNLKEMDVRVILLTDMLLICKKQNKGQYLYKMIRPKYMVDKMTQYPRYAGKVNNELSSLVYVVVDDVGTAYTAFSLSEPKEKDSSYASTGGLKLWEQKFKEAKLTYELGVWYARKPSRDPSEVEVDTSSDYGANASSKAGKQNSEEINIEREARERVAAMLHRSMGASTECDFSQASTMTDSIDVEGEASHTSGRPHLRRHPMHRTSTGGSSRNSRLSSFQQSTSAASHDEPQPGPSRCDYRAGTSVEHLIPPQNPDDAVTSITVNVVSESETESVVSIQPPPTLQRITKAAMSRNSLRVQPSSGVMALVHSLPDLSADPPPPRPQHQHTPRPQSASEKLYQSHQELLQRNRLVAQGQVPQHQYLRPDSRGTSYPPPSPTRASLQRGLAFSYSLKNPPLSKMGHVNSQSTQPDPGPNALHVPQAQHAKNERGAVNPLLVPTPEKPDKKKHFRSRHKGGSSSGRPTGRRDERD